MKIFYILIFVSALFVSNTLPAQRIVLKKKSAACLRHLRLIEATYSYEGSAQRPIGRIYEFTLQVLKPHVKIDSVWFGNTPVPITITDKNAQNIGGKTLSQDVYSAKANRDLYKNFSHNTDSTQHAAHFVPPFVLTHEAAIMYTYKSKRHYLLVGQAIEKEAKKYRE